MFDTVHACMTRVPSFGWCPSSKTMQGWVVQTKANARPSSAAAEFTGATWLTGTDIVVGDILLQKCR